MRLIIDLNKTTLPYSTLSSPYEESNIAATLPSLSDHPAFHGTKESEWSMWSQLFMARAQERARSFVVSGTDDVHRVRSSDLINKNYIRNRILSKISSLALSTQGEHGKRSLFRELYFEMGDKYVISDQIEHRGAAEIENSITWHRVCEVLESFLDLKEGWNGYDAPAPSSRSIAVAKILIDHIQAAYRPAKLAIDGDGDIVLTWRDLETSTFLTVEGNILHLLVKYPDGSNDRIDDLKYDGGAVPKEILAYLPHI